METFRNKPSHAEVSSTKLNRSEFPWDVVSEFPELVCRSGALSVTRACVSASRACLGVSASVRRLAVAQVRVCRIPVYREDEFDAVTPSYSVFRRGCESSRAASDRIVPPGQPDWYGWSDGRNSAGQPMCFT